MCVGGEGVGCMMSYRAAKLEILDRDIAQEESRSV